MRTNGLDQAFPYESVTHLWHGLTKREYIATAVLQGLMANPERYKYVEGRMSLMENQKPWSHEEATRHNAEKAAYIAEALIEALNK